MTDYINKKVNFVQAKLSVKINKKLQSCDNYKVYLCSDSNNSSVNYIMKIAQARSDDRALCNLFNTELIILVLNSVTIAVPQESPIHCPND